MIIAKWLDEAKTLGSLTDVETGHVIILEPHVPGWDEFLKLGGAIETYAAPPPPSADEARAATPPVSRQQLFTALAEAGVITWAEAVAACNRGEVPAIVEGTLIALPVADQARARMKLGAFAMAHRLDPLVLLLGQAAGLSPEAIDQLFETARYL